MLNLTSFVFANKRFMALLERQMNKDKLTFLLPIKNLRI